ncbi:MAG: response regulator transcription factor [Proteobacteria bacterium]|nr:response regulator transcription factor [Pseudomonadota bacterium]MBU4295423.1 response regulator transcription factor [Pseudomonadota bacterium]MCG2747893.1 response regulator transcription factor [Desulfobulbaceae bacterium]
MKKIRVMLVDDHDVVRSGLKSLLGMDPQIEIVGEAANGAEALARIPEFGPEVVVMDISMPTMDGMEATRRISATFPECLVLALTVHEDKQYFFEMLAAGAKGYITKQAAAEELVSAIKAVASGNVYLQPALARWLLEDYQRINKSGMGSGEHALTSADLATLSKRELEILELVAEGLTTPEIGRKLDLSPKTVSRHRERIMNKLNMHSATELVKFAIRTGLIDVR